MLYSEELPTSPKYPTTGVQIDSLCVPDANIAGKRESLPELEVKYHILMDSMWKKDYYFIVNKIKIK